jgi:hypothetical protein
MGFAVVLNVPSAQKLLSLRENHGKNLIHRKLIVSDKGQRRNISIEDNISQCIGDPGHGCFVFSVTHAPAVANVFKLFFPRLLTQTMLT